MLNGICGNNHSFYFVGIGGVSMSALAKLVHSWGKRVAGSDICRSVYTDELAGLGIAVDICGAACSVAGFDVVVYTDAIPESNPQLSEARRLGKTVISRGRFLADVCANFGTVIAVSGCHGKTTCTCMLAHIFSAADKKFCAHIGGRDIEFGNLYSCGNDYFITEACEYKKNFLYLKPDTAIVLNTGIDHLECYKNIGDLKNSYLNFIGSADVKINFNGELEPDGLTFGWGDGAMYSAKKINQTKGKYSFDLFEGDADLGRINLNVYGRHNILNALAATAAARSAQIGFNYIKLGLSQFKGVERRFEKLGDVGGVEFIADYAHHPEEISASISTAKKAAEGRLFVVFQPHTYSRTKLLFKQFVRVLAHLQNLLIYRTYAAREYYDDGGSALTLSQHIKKSRYGDDERDIIDFVSAASAGDMVLFLGAGDIYDIAKSAVKKISARL